MTKYTNFTLSINQSKFISINKSNVTSDIQFEIKYDNALIKSQKNKVNIFEDNLLDIDSKLFSKIRKLIIILFIAFEILAQIFLTKNLFRFKEDLKKYINPLILRIKIFFVTVVFFITCAAFAILAFT